MFVLLIAAFILSVSSCIFAVIVLIKHHCFQDFVLESFWNIRGEKNGLEDRLEQFAKTIEDMQNGVVPDFEAAKRAAEELNRFNNGIANIMGYDPFAARQKMRDKERGMEE